LILLAAFGFAGCHKEDRIIQRPERIVSMREVVRAIRMLPDHLRDVLVLRLHGGHSYEEIAEMTGISLGTVKSRIFYAVKSTRNELKNRGVVCHDISARIRC
jgi:RNA polymerase sigma factor (sigma-70 family)